VKSGGIIPILSPSLFAIGENQNNKLKRRKELGRKIGRKKRNRESLIGSKQHKKHKIEFYNDNLWNEIMWVAEPK
jgi:hypothetical protein